MSLDGVSRHHTDDGFWADRQAFQLQYLPDINGPECGAFRKQYEWAFHDVGCLAMNMLAILALTRGELIIVLNGFSGFSSLLAGARLAPIAPFSVNERKPMDYPRQR